jgi:outer membrane protein assembly factor BamD (BamD/ComL family)
MKKFCLLAICLLVVFVAAPLARAQGNAKQGPDVMRDPDLEKDSLHNLEVARHYFKLKKAYIAALQRCEEIIAGNPVFSKIDEVLFMAGESSLRLADNKGKQASKVTSDKLREEARDYLSQLVNGYPDSSFRKQAEEDLKGLGGPKPKESKQSP